MGKKLSTYIVFIILTCASGCIGDKRQQDIIKWRVTLDRQDKRPYGAWLAWESLKYYFPGVLREPLSRGFRYNDIDYRMSYGKYGHTLLVLEGLDFYVSDKEWKALLEFIKNGNEVVLFCNQLDPKIQQDLDCFEVPAESDGFYGLTNDGTGNQNVLSLVDNPENKYGYEGRSLKGYFTDKKTEHGGSDSTDDYTPLNLNREVLGYAGNQPDLVRYAIGEGHLTLNAAPLVLSNYFLLQDGNKDYLTAIWQTLPGNITRIYWNDFYYRVPGSPGFDILWRFTATKLAILIAIVGLLVYVLFEGKRKQRIIPIVPPLKNDSVSFVETVGRLYYNKGNHTNLEEKMAQQFLEWVRNHYFLNTNLLNEYFIKQLAIKSGLPESTARGLTEMILEIKGGAAKTDDAYLYQLYNIIQQFYKNHPQ